MLYNITKKWINTDYRSGFIIKHTMFHEPQYEQDKNIQRMILIEKYMGNLYDYRFHMAYGNT